MIRLHEAIEIRRVATWANWHGTCSAPVVLTKRKLYIVHHLWLVVACTSMYHASSDASAIIFLHLR